MEPGSVERQLLDTIAAVVQRGRECVDEPAGYIGRRVHEWCV